MKRINGNDDAKRALALTVLRLFDHGERDSERLAEIALDPLMLHLYAALAEKERRLISKRTKSGGQESEWRRPGQSTNISQAGQFGRRAHGPRQSTNAVARTIVGLC